MSCFFLFQLSQSTASCSFTCSLQFPKMPNYSFTKFTLNNIGNENKSEAVCVHLHTHDCLQMTTTGPNVGQSRGCATASENRDLKFSTCGAQNRQWDAEGNRIKNNINMHFFRRERGVNGSRAPVMTPATETHVAPPEDDSGGGVKA